MYLQHIFASAANLGLSVESSILIAIAALACLFGAEVAGICILIRKMNFARRDRMQQEFEEEYISRHSAEEDKHGYAAVALAFGAIPVATQIAFFAVAACAAIGALVFAIVLIVFLAKGYALVSASPAKGKEEASSAEENAEELPEYAEISDESEEQVQEGYTSAEEIFEEAFAEDVEEPVYAEEPAYEEFAEEEAVEEAVEEPAAEPCVAPAAAATPLVGSIPVYSSVYPGGQMPYVEKYVSETYKEVIRETTTTTTTPAQSAEDRYSPATEEILKAIAELMKISSQIRASQEMAVENPGAKSDESVPTLADVEDEDEGEEPDAEEDEELDEEDTAAREDGEDDDEYESDLFSGNERIVGFDEETGCYIVAHYRKSFEAKLIQSRRSVKKYYSEIKNALLAYEGTKDRITWTINNYSNDRAQIAKINVRTRTLDLYLALDPATLEDSAYRGKDVGDKKKYAETPFLFKVNSPRKLTLALELVQRACEEQGLSPIDIETVNYEEQYPFDTTENLIGRGLIREYLREEKPAVTFELDPDHVPQLPEEDGSVIPVNANFTWEFDDEAPVEEAKTEEAPEIAPAPEAETPAETVTVETVAGTTTTTHETVKTTERHYTERYYGAPMQTPYQAQIAPSAQPIEALAEPVAEVTAEEVVEETDAPVMEAVAEETFFEEPIAAEEDVEEEAEALVWDSLEEDTEDEVLEEEVFEDEEFEEEIAEDEEFEEEIAEDEEFEEEIAEDEEFEEEIVEDEEFEEEIAEDEEFEEEIGEDEEFEEEIGEDEEFEEEIVEDEEFEEETFEEEEPEEEEPEAPKPPVAKPASDSSVALLDVCLFDDYFESGATITLDALKEVGLASESAVTLKVYASGAIKGQFTVEANHFTLDAIKAIGDADGDSIMIR